MERIILSADSTCDLGEDLKERFKVRYYPYHIEFRGKDYLDYFRSLAEGGAEVIHLNLGGALSSSHEHACMAAAEVPGVHVTRASCTISSHCGGGRF